MGFSFSRASVAPRSSGGGGSPPPLGSITLSATALEVQLTEGDPGVLLPDELVLDNGGPGTLDNPQVGVTYSDVSGWLTLVPSPQAGGRIRYALLADPTGLTPSVQVATLTFTDAQASNSGITATVTLEVLPGAAFISVSDPTPSVAIVDETASGTPVVVTISSAGAGTIATPTVGTITGTGAPYIASAVITGTGPWTLTITPTATGGTAGVYQATVPIISSGAANTPQAVVVTITVTAQGTAAIGLLRNLDDARYTVGSPTEPAAKVITIQNQGTVPFAGLTIASVTFTGSFSGWGIASLVGQELRITFNCQATITAQGSAVMRVVVRDANAPIDGVYEVFLATEAAPVQQLIGVSPASVTTIIPQGTDAPTTPITVSNPNGPLANLGSISVAFVSPPAWATASYAAGQITLTYVGTSALPAGVQSAVLRVTGSLANNSPVDIPVQLLVQATSAIPRLRYNLPQGVTEDPVTGYRVGVPTGVITTAPAGWDAPATHTPANASALQSALNQSASASNANGDGNVIIQLDPSVVYVGNFTLPAPTTRTGWVVIRSASWASLPAEGTRINPATQSALLAEIRTPNSDPALAIGSSAAKLWCAGLTFSDTLPQLSSVCYNLVRCQPATNQLGQANVPVDMYWRHCWFKGNPRLEGGTFRGLYHTAFRTGVMDSYFSDMKVQGFETQCILIPHSGGFYYYHNNFLEAAGECIMTGGNGLPSQDPSWNPTDIYIKQNVMTSRLSWCRWHPTYAGFRFGHKNLFETKRCIRLLLDGNVFKDGYQEAQAGIQIVFKSSNQNGDNLNSRTDDVQMVDCWGYNLARTFNVISIASNNLSLTPPLIHQSAPSERTHVLNCLFERVNVDGLTNKQQQGHVIGYLVETANRARDTVIEKTSIVWNGGIDVSGSNGCCAVDRMINIEVIDNIWPQRTYGFKASGANEGNASFNQEWTNYQVTRNVLYGGGTVGASLYPPGNTFPANEAAIGWVNPTSGTTPLDFDFLPSSPYYGDGVTPTRGCNVKRVHYMTDGVLAGTPTNP